jgi:hypothetical protein
MSLDAEIVLNRLSATREALICDQGSAALPAYLLRPFPMRKSMPWAVSR